MFHTGHGLTVLWDEPSVLPFMDLTMLLRFCDLAGNVLYLKMSFRPAASQASISTNIGGGV